MKNAAKLDDFAHDICVAGLGVVFLTVVGTSLSRPAKETRRLPRNDAPAPLSWTEAGWTETSAPPIVAASRNSSFEGRSSMEQARATAGFASELEPVGEPQRILLAGESAGAGSSAAR